MPARSHDVELRGSLDLNRVYPFIFAGLKVGAEKYGPPSSCPQSLIFTRREPGTLPPNRGGGRS